MIRYLDGTEKERCRALWEEAFGDSASFCDYYFKDKIQQSRVLACEENGRIISMLHRNPYRIYMRGEEAVCDYIVGVSTAISERNKGHMRNLMLTVLRDMQEDRMPFAFLMPARESLYLPYDFRYIFDQPRWVLKYGPEIRRVPLAGDQLTAELAEWQNAWLKRQYEVFAVRDGDYVSQIGREVESEAGSVSLVYDGDWFVGMESEWGLKEREQRYLYTGEKYRTLASSKPAIMARIICLPEFLCHIRLSEACPQEEITVEIGVNDLFVPQNQGAWLWTLTKSGSSAVQESRFISRGKMGVLTIAELTQWLFGYQVPKTVKEIPLSQYIAPFDGVFLDEVV